jgi:hypothetical protein
MYEIATPNGAKHRPPEGRCWKNLEDVFRQYFEEGRIWFGSDGCGVPRQKTYLSERKGKNNWTLWMNDEVWHSQGGFAFYELGERLLLEDGNLNENLDAEKIREYI